VSIFFYPCIVYLWCPRRDLRDLIVSFILGAYTNFCLSLFSNRRSLTYSAFLQSANPYVVLQLINSILIAQE